RLFELADDPGEPCGAFAIAVAEREDGQRIEDERVSGQVPRLAEGPDRLLEAAPSGLARRGAPSGLLIGRQFGEAGGVRRPTDHELVAGRLEQFEGMEGTHAG